MSVRLSTSMTETAVPVTRADLEAYFHQSAKPVGQWRVGAEFEKFLVVRATGRPLTFEEPGGVRDVMTALAERYGWKPHHNERGFLTALSRDGASVSLEPGGQVEFATSPAAHLADIENQLNRHLVELRTVIDADRVAILAVGVVPLTSVEEIPLMPRVRHAVMAEYLPRRSATALLMMKATASTQVTLDYGDEADAVRKFVTAIKLGPIVNAIWGNAPLLAGKRTEFVSVRGDIWRGMDPDRSGLLIPLLNNGFSFANWIDYLLDVPMMFTFIGGRYRPANGMTFREFMARGVDSYFPTKEDWEIQLTTVFPDVRLKSFLEIRGADATQRSLSVSVPAFWKGLMYDAESLSAAAKIAETIPPGELPDLFASAYRQGLHAVFRGRPLREWCRELATLAADGLRRIAERNRDFDERMFLEPAYEILERGSSPGAKFHAAGPNPSAGARPVVEWFEYEVPFYQI